MLILYCILTCRHLNAEGFLLKVCFCSRICTKSESQSEKKISVLYCVRGYFHALICTLIKHVLNSNLSSNRKKYLNFQMIFLMSHLLSPLNLLICLKWLLLVISTKSPHNLDASMQFYNLYCLIFQNETEESTKTCWL